MGLFNKRHGRNGVPETATAATAEPPPRRAKRELPPCKEGMDHDWRKDESFKDGADRLGGTWVICANCEAGAMAYYKKPDPKTFEPIEPDREIVP